MRPLRWRFLWLSIWLAMLAAVAIGSLLPAHDLPPLPLFAQADKLEHLLGYAALAAWAALLFSRSRTLVVVAFGLVAFGVGIEIAQALFTIDRQAEVLDALADAVGVALGLSVARSRHADLLLRIEVRLGKL